LKASVYDVEGTAVGSVELPGVFQTPVNQRLINRAFWIVFTHKIQRKGTSPIAGERTSAQSWNTGHGVARVRRVKGEKNPRAGQAGGVGGVVKGRLTHPPRVEKVIYKLINKKERLAALRSAIAATAHPDLVVGRGHAASELAGVPLVADDKLQEVVKASELRAFFGKVGLLEDIERASRRKTRAGKQSWRGRRRKTGKGPLLVVTDPKGLGRAAGGFPGVDVVSAQDLSIIDLAPGGKAGRLTLWTKSALDSVSKRFEEVVVNAA
jgi:large subunit ribosomal protein L4e